MQEDQFYAKYLERRVSIETGKTELVEIDIKEPKRIAGRGMEREILSGEVVLPKPKRSSRGISIQMNDLLPNFVEIVDSLKNNGFNISTTFGSTSTYKETPEFNLVSISHDVPIGDLQALLRLLGDKIDYVGPANQPFEKGRVYIGSYAYKDKSVPMARYTESLRKKLLANGLEKGDLIHLLGVEPIDDEL